MTPIRVLALLSVSLVGTCACSGKRSSPPTPAPSATVTQAPASSAAAMRPREPGSGAASAAAGPPLPGDTPDPSADPEAPTTACRAITVKGSVSTESGKKVVAGDVLDRPEWLNIAASSEMAVKHATTAREIVFHGPARVLPCDRGEERFLMTRGRAVTATWAGARPGSEVLIATPLAVVRYGDATLDVRIGSAPGATTTLSVNAAVGDAFIDVGDGTGGQRVAGGNHAERKGDAVDVKALVAACDRGAQAAEALARDVLAPLAPRGGAAPLGERAAAHVRGRRAARMQCAIAAAALGTLEKGQDRDDLGRAVAAAEARWRGIPSSLRR